VDKQIAINSTLDEARVAIIEDGDLAEIHIERTKERGIAGNLYKGKVVRVLPGMQAAFVDIGLDKAAFLHVSDLFTAPSELPPEVAEDGSPAEDAETAIEFERPRPPRPRHRPIEELLKKGNELLVQVSKEPIGSKGARVTGHISLPGRYLVYMPTVAHLGISRRIEDEEERARLREIVDGVRPAEGGLIVRTACAGVSKREIVADVRFLTRLWGRIQKKAAATGPPALIHYDMDLVLRMVRDTFTQDVSRVVVDNPRDHQRIVDFVENLVPRLTSRIELYDGAEPLFDHLGVETKIAKALERRVWLKSGGHIVIDQTEALTTVDVNTGRYVGKRSQEETILKTNLEAAREVMDQLRLRNIGGIIIIDFIDMENAANRKKVVDTLTEAVKKDKARTNIMRISELGLVEMTRKRTRESLEAFLCSPCPYCEGRGRIKAVETMAYDLLRRLQKEAALHPGAQHLTLSVHPAVATFLCDQAPRGLELIEQQYATKIVVKAVAGFHHEPFEIAAGT
jgi:ribonuclease G